MMPKTLRALGSATFATLLAACQTPAPVYELAEKSSANAGIFQKHLSQMGSQSKGLAGTRAGRVADMDAYNRELEAYIKRELFMREKSMKPDDWRKRTEMMAELARLRDELIAIEVSGRFARQERKKAILQNHVDLDAYQASLREVVGALNALAKRENAATRAAFFGSFMGDVQKEIKAALDKNEGAAKEVNKLLDKIKSDSKDE